ncbi:hypothetical protein V8E55_009979 [Tylopilus felleus]
MWVYSDDQGSTETTFLEFGRAAHRIAHALRPGHTGDDGQVVILIATTDTILHQVIVAGMSIAGLVVSTSPNSPAAVISIMKKINCSRIVTLYDAHRNLIDALREQGSDLAFTVEEMPPISYAFPKLGHEIQADLFIPYPHSASRPDQNRPSIYIHSSGSTGFPKAIPQSYKVQIHWMYHIMTAYFHKLSPGDRAGAIALPPFHSLGITMQLYLPLAYLVTIAVYPPQTTSNRREIPIVPTSDNILDGVCRTHCKVVITVPAFLEQWAVSIDAVEVLAKLDRVICGGGPISDKIGNALWAAGANISIAYGGTEFGSPLSARSRSEVQHGEWMWVQFSEDIQARCVPQGNGTYECQVLTTENNQVSIENLTDTKGYATSDLFIKHPTKNLWKIVGRADDVIALASGEKIVPILMEGIIVTSPFVQGVIMFGRERNQVGVLVEPCPEHAVDVLDDNAVTAFKDQIWPAIEEANKIAPAFARIFKEMILIVDVKQPMIRTPKGTVQRKATIEIYEAKINSLYTDVDVTYSYSSESTGPLAWTPEGILPWLTAHASLVSQGRRLDPSSDLFAQGFDSLSVISLRNQVINALRRASDARVRSSVTLVSPNIVFENPSLQLLASQVSSIVGEREVSQSLDRKQRHVAKMETMIQRYSVKLSGSASSAMVDGTTNGLVSHPSCAVVLLTGSTGGLGSILLSQLLQNPRVVKCSSFIDKGLSTDLLGSEKLVYIEADASQDNCGFPPELYKEIRESVTIIIHNAWRVDFNLSLVSFEPNIRATRNLVDLALDAKHRGLLHFVFTSSIGTAQSWDLTKGVFPEELQLDPSTAVGLGYGESKYVCERIIAKSGLRATSLRIGQIAGGSNRSWAATDWVPIIVKSSISLGALPNSTGEVSWMRAEDVAAAVLDVAFAESAPQSLNIVNPQRPRWSDVISSIRDTIVEQKSWHQDCLIIVPFVEWVIRLEKKTSAASPEDLVNIPAFKLLERTAPGLFSKPGGIADFNTTEAQRISNTVRKMQPVGEIEAKTWVQYWISKRLF